MPIPADLREILVCPKCKGDLQFFEEKNEIHCPACRLVYPIENGIPTLLVELARPLPA